MTPPTVLECVLALGSVPVMAVVIYWTFVGIFALVEFIQDTRERRRIARRAAEEAR